MDNVRHWLRWLLVHPILFAWILAFIAILLNWAVGGKAPDQAAHDAKAPHAQMAGKEHGKKHGEGEQGDTQGSAAQGQGDTAAAAVAPPPADAQSQAVATAASGAGAWASQQAPTTAATPAAPAQEVPASASIAEQVAAVAPVTASVTTPDMQAQASADASAEDLLLAAREAYWAGELDRSAGFYQSLLLKDEQPAYKGELANVFWKQGKSAEAVALYTAIAPWMAEQGRMDELRSIKVYADMVDPAKAAEIGALLK